jgi:hypothetical protein
VAEIARKIKRYFIDATKSFGSCSLHPYFFRWVAVALSYGVVWDCPLATARDDQVSRPREYAHPESDPMHGGVEADPTYRQKLFLQRFVCSGRGAQKIFDTNADKFSSTSVSPALRELKGDEWHLRPTCRSLGPWHGGLCLSEMRRTMSRPRPSPRQTSKQGCRGPVGRRNARVCQGARKRVSQTVITQLRKLPIRLD